MPAQISTLQQIKNRLLGVPQGRLDIRYALFTDFTQIPKLDATFELNDGSLANLEATTETALIAHPGLMMEGTNAVNTCGAYAASGGVTLTTTTASADQVIISPASHANLPNPWYTTEWSTAKQVRFSCVIETASANLATTTIWAGLKLTKASAVDTDNDQAFFRFAGASDTYWTMNTSNNGTDSSVNTTKAPAVSTVYAFDINVDSNRYPHYYINGDWVGTGVQLASLTTLKPFIGVQTATTAARAITVKSLGISRTY